MRDELLKTLHGGAPGAANMEVEKCGGVEMTNEQAQDPIPVFNNILANGCP
jgi:hypothetical protein